jgi:hypothetical protein
MNNQITRMLMTALLAVFVWGCRPPQVSSPHPLPAGHVGIHVAFKGIPTEADNKLSGFLMKLAEEHSALRQGSESLRDVGDRHSYGGLMNDGFAVQQYNPNHPVPSPEVEQTMKERLKTFLKDNNIDPDDTQLELRYGK